MGLVPGVVWVWPIGLLPFHTPSTARSLCLLPLPEPLTLTMELQLLSKRWDILITVHGQDPKTDPPPCLLVCSNICAIASCASYSIKRDSSGQFPTWHVMAMKVRAFWSSALYGCEQKGIEKKNCPGPANVSLPCRFIRVHQVAWWMKHSDKWTLCEFLFVTSCKGKIWMQLFLWLMTSWRELFVLR